VLLEHWRNALFVDYPAVPHPNLPLKLFYLLSSIGHQAVIVFFILSGYLIGGSIFRAFQEQNWSWKRYLTHRLVRLWIVLIPGLALGAAWDSLALRSHLAPGMYGGLGTNHMVPDVHQTLSLRVYAGNVLFLQTIFVPTLGSNGSLWSLANEFWYYMLFPLGYFVIHRKGSRKKCLLLFSLLMLVIWLTRGSILLLFPIWLLGVALLKLKSVPVRRLYQCLSTLLYLSISVIFAKIRINDLLKDYLFAVVSTIYLWILLSATNEASPHRPLNRFARHLASFSYTLYIVHLPFLLYLGARTNGDSRWLPTSPTLLKALPILLSSLLYAYAVAAVTEFRTDRFRKFIEHYIGG
jgi:peptidoglycan/LPS O-acetylase OafA/YrhL